MNPTADRSSVGIIVSTLAEPSAGAIKIPMPCTSSPAGSRPVRADYSARIRGAKQPFPTLTFPGRHSVGSSDELGPNGAIRRMVFREDFERVRADAIGAIPVLVYHCATLSVTPKVGTTS